MKNSNCIFLNEKMDREKFAMYFYSLQALCKDIRLINGERQDEEVIRLTKNIGLRREINQDRADDTVGEIFNRTIGQLFTFKRPNLSRIEVKFATYTRRNTGHLRYVLMDGGTWKILVSDVIDIGKLRDNEWYPLSFLPIADSNGKLFYLYFEAPHSSPGNAITIWKSGSPLKENNTIYENHAVPISGSLCIRAYCISDLS